MTDWRQCHQVVFGKINLIAVWLEIVYTSGFKAKWLKANGSTVTTSIQTRTCVYVYVVLVLVPIFEATSLKHFLESGIQPLLPQYLPDPLFAKGITIIYLNPCRVPNLIV